MDVGEGRVAGNPVRSGPTASRGRRDDKFERGQRANLDKYDPRLALEPYTQSCDPYTPGLFAMRTNIEIDDQLLSEPMRTSGARTKKAAVEAGLRLLVKTYSQTAIRRLRSKVRSERVPPGPQSGLVDHYGKRSTALLLLSV